MAKLMIAVLAAGVALAGCTTPQRTPASAAAEKRDADYRVAIQKCDNLGSAERAACIEDAKERFGKS